MKCSCCGKEISVQDKYCDYCGQNNDYYGMSSEDAKHKEQTFHKDSKPKQTPVQKQKVEVPKEVVKPKVVNKETVEVRDEKPEIKKEAVKEEFTLEEPQKTPQQILDSLSSELEQMKNNQLKDDREEISTKNKENNIKEHVKYIKLESLGNLLIRKEKYTKLEYNTKILIPIGLEVFVYKNNSLDQVFYDGGEEILNKGKKGLFSNKIDPATYTIFTVNTNHIRNDKWGTKYPIPYYDKELGTHIQLSAIGSYKYSISDPEMFIKKVVGDKDSISNVAIYDFFYEMVLQDATGAIAKELTSHNYYEMYQIQRDLSESIKDELRKKLNTYGIGLKEFIISAFKVDPEWVIEEHRKLQFAKSRKSSESC